MKRNEDRKLHRKNEDERTLTKSGSSGYLTKRVLPQSGPVLMTVTPNTVLPSAPSFSVDEPIEAGSFKMSSSQLTLSMSNSESSRRKSSASHGPEVHMDKEFIRNLPFKRPGLTWETMTDDEREEAQRLKRKEEAFKTALCDVYKRTGSCSYGHSCRFAHGEHELRLPAQPRGKSHPKYKTQLCDKFSMYGTCPYGQRCQFIHKLKKGLPLVEYERMLANGRISPARDDENRLSTENESSVQSGWQPIRLDVLPPAASHRQRPALSKEKTELPYREPVSRYPLPLTKNVENARTEVELVAFERAFKEAAMREKMQQREERERMRDDEKMADMKRRRIEEQMLRMQPQLGRSASLQTLSEGFDRSSNVRDIKGVTKVIEETVAVATVRTPKKKVPELSLIDEEEEHAHENSHNLVVSTNHWQEMIFGKKLMPIAEESEDRDVNSQKQHSILSHVSEIDERQLLVQSCDEELLTQGLYDHRYPDHSDLVRQWKNEWRNAECRNAECRH